MKKVYVQPEVEIISLKLFGSLLDDTDDTHLGAASYMDTAGEGDWGARSQNFFDEEEEDLQVWNAGYTSSKLWLE